ncbi:hypothetical protein BV898_03810 [Hypsibius exemplaris]|uniref:Uncharacterized protein n=1 Tax=Hypsibius exemplaris TaxID=2072580 RepID=A0A1W0X4I5_HYPEX|nr:hypothetical protein BV898_03810 [Hypsibius exemplaris]
MREAGSHRAASISKNSSAVLHSSGGHPKDAPEWKWSAAQHCVSSKFCWTRKSLWSDKRKLPGIVGSRALWGLCPTLQGKILPGSQRDAHDGAGPLQFHYSITTGCAAKSCLNSKSSRDVGSSQLSGRWGVEEDELARLAVFSDGPGRAGMALRVVSTIWRYGNGRAACLARLRFAR